MALAPVLPVLTIERVDDAVPMARTLVKGGLPVLEITLRTAAAMAALKAMVAEVPEAVGAETVLEALEVEQVRQAGAFCRQSGLYPQPCRGNLGGWIAFLLGVQTVSEAMALAERGFRLSECFPADAAAGFGWPKAVGAPLAGLRFCPTGGIGADTAQAYLSLANVACVGGSWVAPRYALAARDWPRVERLAAAAAKLKRS